MSKLTHEDIIKYILKIQLNFEKAYRLETDTERQLLVESWMDIFGKYPKEIFDLAFNNVMAKAKFAPRIGDITEEINALYNAGKKTDEELWTELTDIKYEVWDTSRYLRYPQHYDEAIKKLNTIYENLSDELKLYLVNVSALVEFSEHTSETLPYEKARFFKNMPVLRKHAEDKISASAFLQLAEVKTKQITGKKKKQ